MTSRDIVYHADDRACSRMSPTNITVAAWRRYDKADMRGFFISLTHGTCRRGRCDACLYCFVIACFFVCVQAYRRQRPIESDVPVPRARIRSLIQRPDESSVPRVQVRSLIL